MTSFSGRDMFDKKDDDCLISEESDEESFELFVVISEQYLAHGGQSSFDFECNDDDGGESSGDDEFLELIEQSVLQARRRCLFD